MTSAARLDFFEKGEAVITANRRKSDAVMAAVISHSIKPSLLLFNARVTLPLIFFVLVCLFYFNGGGRLKMGGGKKKVR